MPQTLDVGMEFVPEPRAGGSGARPYGIYPTREGRWFAAGITDQFWNGFCEAAGLGELAEHPDFATGEARTQNADRLEEIVEATFRSRTSEEWEASFLEHRLPGSRVLTLDEAFHHPAAAMNKMLVEVPTSRNRVVHVPGFPIKFSRSGTGRWTEPPGW